MVPQETAAHSSFSLWYPEELRHHVQLLSQHHACKTQFFQRELEEEKHDWPPPWSSCISLNVFQDKWRRLVAEGKNNIEMFDHVTLMTLDSLLKCAFSHNSNCQEWDYTRLINLADIHFFLFTSMFLMKMSLQVYQWVCVSHSGAQRPDNRAPAKYFAPLGVDLLEVPAGKAVQAGLKRCTQVCFLLYNMKSTMILLSN